MSEIQANGLSHNGRIYCVSVGGFICDKPARSFLKCVKGHSGTYGCDKCTQSGVYIAGRMTFPVTKAPLRTDVPDVAFGEMVDDAYHHERYPLCQLALSMVTAFPLDYMHLVCLGVMKLFAWWFKGPLECRIGHHVKTLISSNLLPYQPFVSKEFVRKPRDLAEVDRWKATEFRQFLLYLGPVTLTGLIDLAMYNNFMLFPVAMYIYIYIHTLASSLLCHEKEDDTQNYLELFVGHCSDWYEPTSTVYNVHALVHLVQDVKVYGCLDKFSAFPFESFIDMLKKLVRKPSHPLQQVIKRLKGRSKCNVHNLVCNVCVYIFVLCSMFICYTRGT